MGKTDRYQTANMAQWSGRVDDPDDRACDRWHQVIRSLDLRGEQLAPLTAPRNICLLGFASDEGVKRNLGRSGAVQGPAEIRKSLASLPWHGSADTALYDAGDLLCADHDLQAAQQNLAAAVESICRLGAFPIVLGGGHEVAYGTWKGLRSTLSGEDRFGIVNVDAHFDIRPFDKQPSSGTMFAQIAADCAAAGEPFDYFCLGIQKTGNTRALFETAKQLGIKYLLADQLQPQAESAALQHFRDYLQGCDRLYLTLCSDAICAADAPGVSAPQPFGLPPDVVRRLIAEIAASGKLVGFDIAEVSPPLDRDNKTSALAAQLIFHLVDGLSQSF